MSHRVRLSTVALAVVFAGVLALYVEVRPPPAPVTGNVTVESTTAPEPTPSRSPPAPTDTRPPPAAATTAPSPSTVSTTGPVPSPGARLTSTSTPATASP